MYVTVIQQQHQRAQKSCIKYKEVVNGYGCILEPVCMKTHIQWKLFFVCPKKWNYKPSFYKYITGAPAVA